MGVALTALDAVVQIEGARGRRSVALGEFYQESADQPGRTTVLEHGELITAVDLPPSPFANHSHYLKVRERTSFAFATVSVAAALDVQDGKVRDARLVLGGVATRPWRATSSEALLIGHAPDPTLYQEAAQMALRETWPRRDNAFKVELTRRAIVRALSIVGGKL
jgi:xanthine dehydrogenase YagS FAD-binding subunit